MTAPEDLMYLRADDLSEEEQAALDAWLATHPAQAAEREAVLSMGQDLAELGRSEKGPSLDALFASLEAADLPETEEFHAAMAPPTVPEPANRPRWWIVAAPLLAVAAAVVLVVPSMLGQGEGRWRGGTAGPGPEDVVLEAVAEGPSGTRALLGGTQVAANERVVFFVSTKVPGVIYLAEGEEEFWSTGQAPVDAGRWSPGGEQPLSYRPDTEIEGATYTARLCAGPEAEAPCAVAELSLRW